MSRIIKLIVAPALMLLLFVGCNKEVSAPVPNTGSPATVEQSPTADDLAKIAEMERQLDSLNNLSVSDNEKLAPGIGGLPDKVKEIIEYFKGGVEGVEKIKILYYWWRKYFGHTWVVISYADGYCIFNRVRSYRTADDIINTAMGRGGDCDWWVWPEKARKHVCLRNKKDTDALIKKHGKIINIRPIDHPTKNCGK